MSRLRVVASDAPELEPDEPIRDGVPSPGGYIREQRQRQSMSVEQLAVATKIPASSLRLLEEDRYSELPGPVFVKGFLRCATRALGLPSETVMELLYERERAALAARRQQPRVGGAAPESEGAAVCAQVPRLPPRVKERTAPDGGVAGRLWPMLTGTNALMWLVVAAFVAVLVMAAFNLAGDASIGPHA